MNKEISKEESREESKLADFMISNYLIKFPREFFFELESKSDSFIENIISNLNHLHKSILIKNSPAFFMSKYINLIKISKIADFIDPSYIARIISHLKDKEQSEILASLPEKLSKELSSLLSYPQDTAGSLMDTRFLSFFSDSTVDSTLKAIRQNKNKISNIFIIDADHKLEGKIPLQALITENKNTRLSELAEFNPLSANDLLPKDDVIEMVEKFRLSSVPVTDINNTLVGIIPYQNLIKIVEEQTAENLQKMVGVNKDERALSSPFFSVKKRLPWLSINLLTTFMAAFVVYLFEATIAQITALAVLLPVVAGQSGNTGAQAQAITMRGFALREIRFRHTSQIIFKEAAVGMINGIMIGSLCMVAVFFWSGSAALSGVIGAAMVLAMICASIAGALVPILLIATGQDPAASSSIILTTITDIIGFLSFLGLATLFINQLA